MLREAPWRGRIPAAAPLGWRTASNQVRLGDRHGLVTCKTDHRVETTKTVRGWLNSSLLNHGILFSSSELPTSNPAAYISCCEVEPALQFRPAARRPTSPRAASGRMNMLWSRLAGSREWSWILRPHRSLPACGNSEAAGTTTSERRPR